MSDQLPCEVLAEILCNLPVVTLLQCLSVCKAWRSLIKTPIFISLHLAKTLSSSSDGELLLLRTLSDNKEQYSLRVNEGNRFFLYKSFNFPFNPLFSFRVIGSCNGLVCLFDKNVGDGYSIVLWNPMIRQSVTLPRTSTSGCYTVELIGFGYDSTTDDFKVLRMATVPRGSLSLSLSKIPRVCEVYSFKSGCWKDIIDISPGYEIDQLHVPVYANGAIHWITSRKRDQDENGESESENIVVAFDLRNEVFREIKLPSSLASVLGCKLCVKAFGESSIAVVKQKSGIWVMSEYGDEESWYKVHIGSVYKKAASVLGFSKNGGEAFIESYSGHILSVELDSLRFKDVLVQGSGYSFLGNYTESLVLFDN